MRTRRLTLRSLTYADAERIAELGGDWDVARMTGRIPYPYSAEMAGHWIDDLAPGEVVFGIVRDGKLIGLCGYTRSQDGSADIGYWIGRPYWGNGYATEAARAVLNHGFTQSGVKRFTCCHFTDNPASQRVIEKLGFRKSDNCRGWCEARQLELPTIRYEQRRPLMAALKALAS
jgi:[ribosomal protein S5]-alanine N-acetyltransferase